MRSQFARLMSEVTNSLMQGYLLQLLAASVRVHSLDEAQLSAFAAMGTAGALTLASMSVEAQLLPPEFYRLYCAFCHNMLSEFLREAPEP